MQYFNKNAIFKNFILHLTYINVFEFQKFPKNICEIYVKYIKYMRCVKCVNFENYVCFHECKF